MTSSAAHLAQLEDRVRKSRRTVLGHFVFLLICCVAAVLLRRFFRFPPQLSWVVFAAAGVAFAGDIAHLIYCRLKLRFARRVPESS